MTRKSKLIWFVSLSVLILLAHSTVINLFAETDDASKKAAVKTDESEIKAAPDRIKEKDKPNPTTSERVDEVFGTIVDGLLKVLFFKVGSHEQQFVQLDIQLQYVRSGDQTDFKKVSLSPALSASETEYLKKLGLRESAEQLHLLTEDGQFAETLTTGQAEALKARGKLVLRDKDKEVYHIGEFEKKEVQFVTVKLEAKSKLDAKVKYVWLDEQYKPMLPGKRELVSEEKNDYLSSADIQSLALLGWLKNADEPSDSENPHYHSEDSGGMPFVVLWLVLGGIFFTIYFRGFNFRGFRHSIDVIRGKYDNPDEPGEVTHFQALMSALSATVGLGNIAGVTMAMATGGAGAFFWMLVCGFLGMSSKFVESTLGQKYRTVKPDGTVLGGPMRYLHVGLKELNLGGLGLVLSVMFTIMCILASFGGGNMFQANQSGNVVLYVLQKEDRQQLGKIDEQIAKSAKDQNDESLQNAQEEKTKLKGNMDGFANKFKIFYGVILGLFVGVVIIGGIKRIGKAAEKIVPSMCLLYVTACIYIIFTHISDVPDLVASVFREAFSGQAIGGGIIGVLVIGFQRAAFSNEAGVGSAAIAHSAAKTDEPVREGTVALMGPFIDTIVVCSMTALVILITGAWDNSAMIVEQGLEGSQLTSAAFEKEISWFPWVLAFAVIMFAYSTIISWSYYGEKCWESLFGPRSIMVYKVLCVGCVVLGSYAKIKNVLEFSDLMILSMAFPNILGAVLLAPKIKRDLAEYWRRYRADEFKTFK